MRPTWQTPDLVALASTAEAEGKSFYFNEVPTSNVGPS